MTPLSVGPDGKIVQENRRQRAQQELDAASRELGFGTRQWFERIVFWAKSNDSKASLRALTIYANAFELRGDLPSEEQRVNTDFSLEFREPSGE